MRTLKVILFFVVLTVIGWGAWYYVEKQDREQQFQENELLRSELSKLHDKAQRVEDSLRDNNPDPALTKFSIADKADKLTSHVQYTKKMLAERAHIDLVHSPDSLLLEEPENEDVEAIFFNENDRFSDYHREELIERLSKFIRYAEEYSNRDVAGLIQSREILSANHVCGEMQGSDCYAHLVKSLNRLSIELEKFKLDLLRNG
ncbi:hypothetical protein [Salibacter halophilus]|uniref:Uncharacterized protein n=1 Tax=Salibacter halophilus TaxID=1803916 RepID=A0A6N6M809_9FLAO|nr:hypothetical protein [Salibacter halophilus]KAB1063222.1 hypothetical protein F3059_11305 [Salibacter halophilus]